MPGPASHDAVRVPHASMAVSREHPRKFPRRHPTWYPTWYPRELPDAQGSPYVGEYRYLRRYLKADPLLKVENFFKERILSPPQRVLFTGKNLDYLETYQRRRACNTAERGD
jgi:hypothetical protein